MFSWLHVIFGVASLLAAVTYPDRARVAVFCGLMFFFTIYLEWVIMPADISYAAYFATFALFDFAWGAVLLFSRFHFAAAMQFCIMIIDLVALSDRDTSAYHMYEFFMVAFNCALVTSLWWLEAYTKIIIDFWRVP